ncbi:MAG: hypothetical protein HQL09_03060 [Nitrospirae bacterium]|nr:hypothetical protein [Nitrospirota bacterium]
MISLVHDKSSTKLTKLQRKLIEGIEDVLSFGKVKKKKKLIRVVKTVTQSPWAAIRKGTGNE